MRIDRLTLHTGALSEGEARELARLVAEDIAALPLAPASAVRLTVAQPGASDVASLREAVARAIESALTAAPATGRADTGSRS